MSEQRTEHKKREEASQLALNVSVETRLLEATNLVGRILKHYRAFPGIKRRASVDPSLRGKTAGGSGCLT